MTDKNENIETQDTLSSEEAQVRSTSILGKLRKKINTKIVAAATVVTMGSAITPTEAFGQSNGGGYSFTPISATEARVLGLDGGSSTQTVPQRTSGATISYQQAAASQSYQAVFNDLPPYAQQRVTDLGMQNRIITRYNTATGLNRPADGIIYACAIPDPAIPGNVMFIPVEESLYKAGAKNPTPIPTISVPAQDAEIMMTRPNQRSFSPSRDGTTKCYSQKSNPMYSHVEFMVTLENGIRTLRTENYQKNRLFREQTKAQTGPLQRANQRARAWNNEVRNTTNQINRAKQNVRNIKRTFGGIFDGGRH